MARLPLDAPAWREPAVCADGLVEPAVVDAMSYAHFVSAEIAARWANHPDWQPTRSDVYVLLACGGFLECCSCRLLADCESFRADSTDRMLAHLREHIAAGHAVPDYTIPELEADRADNDAFIAGVSA